jgi:hypothetical protein
MTNSENVYTFFGEELSLIDDDALRETTELALIHAPKYFWEIPASLTGKHHSAEDRKPQGNLRHSAKVGWLAWKLFDAFGFKPDLGMCAGLVHDIQKYGPFDQPDANRFYSSHGRAAARWLEDLAFVPANWFYKHKSDEFDRDWTTICKCVETHMGRFGRCSREFARATLEQQIFHAADVMAASKAFSSLKYGAPEQAPPLSELLDRRLFFDRTDEGLKIAFGKHKGRTIRAVIYDYHAYSYIEWLLNQFFIPAYQLEWLQMEIIRVRDEVVE